MSAPVPAWCYEGLPVVVRGSDVGTVVEVRCVDGMWLCWVRFDRGPELLPVDSVRPVPVGGQDSPPRNRSLK